MYLKTLTARGFKSFADKITLDFESGISVIVGPNGSGKSNVADAVLWVLGEQSPRNLRGTKMEDVIFAGSATRQPLSMAEVSLSFDNRKGEIPIEFPEVVVTRRLFRTGESEYLLNKTPCRLVDIQELLSDLGVGRELTAVIGQNRLETILRSRPEDRRVFLEEVAGLRKHRRRKDKALRKIEGMERNLVRVSDIISEVRKQLRPLERQAKQAMEYQEMVVEVKDLSIRIMVAELQELKGQWENRRQEEEGLLQELEQATGGIKEGKERLSTLEAELKSLREVLEECRLREMRLLSLGERLRACERLGEERLKLYAALGGEIRYGQTGWMSRRQEMARKRQELEGERARTEEDISRLAAEKERTSGLKKSLSSRLNQARKERDGLRRAWASLEKDQAELRKEQCEAWDRADQCREDGNSLRARGELLLKESRKLAEEIRKLEKKAAEAESRRSEVEEKVKKTKADITRFREELEAVARKQKRSYQEEALVVARLRALHEIFSSRLDYAAAAARVLDESMELPGIEGILLHRIHIQEEWERALESYLGPWLFSVVTRSLDDALEAVRVLKKEEGGYGVFLPLSEIPSAAVDDRKESAHLSGGTPALEVVTGDKEIEPALRYLLGDVVFCCTLDEAESEAEKDPGLTFVTSEGDVIAPRRVVKGGALPRNPFHIIAKRREIEELQDMLDLCDEESISLEVQRKSALATISGLERDLAQLEEERGSLESTTRDMRISLKEKELQSGNLELELHSLMEQQAVVGDERSRLRHCIIDFEVEASALQGEMEARMPMIIERERWVGELREEEGKAIETLQGMRAERASLAERRFHLEERLKELEMEESSPAPPGKEELAEKSRLQEEMLVLVKGLAREHQRLSLQVQKREENGKEELAGNEEEYGDMRQRLEEMESREEELREQAHNRDLAAAQLKMQVDMLVQRLLDEYRVPLETALKEYTPSSPVEDMRQRLEKLERRKDMLGQVNLRAVEEHKVLKERHDFLLEQVEDLKESKSSLMKVIRAIDREIVRIFKDTFEVVNQHFQELFDRLFPQGRAELALSDPTDLLNTGVEIEAQPRGKRLKKLSLLSGGETALTSLAFLFALFKTRPSPFYFLDEVEAALDDVNLHRFLNMLMEFKGESQLIIITHQKRTMERADVLYGVSMQASGVSRIISKKLGETEELASSEIA